MKRTPLYDAHVALGAKMVEFGGWEMPIRYTTILDEHRAVRERAGMFDVSHMGDLIVRGPGAEGSLRELLTNDIKDLAVGKGIYAHLLNEQGKIIDDAITFRLGEEVFLLIPNASHAEGICEWLTSHVRNAGVTDVTERLACIALQGPKASEVLQRLTSQDLGRIKHLRGDLVDLRISAAADDGERRFLPDLCALPSPAPGTVQCYVTRSGYTGEDGFEILLESSMARALWEELLTGGKDLGVQPAGLGARDLLRLEMGYLLSGTDFDGSQTSLETGPEWVIKWDHRFIGREALLKQKDCAMFRKLVGIELLEKGIPRHGYPLTFNHREVGKVTSGSLSPILNRGIALAYVNLDHAKEGDEIEVTIRDSSVKAQVVRPPFIRREVSR
jgi:aminomethyltransferase